jgi:hypothetical protein
VKLSDLRERISECFRSGGARSGIEILVRCHVGNLLGSYEGH